MYRLVESIRIENGRLQLLELHSRRISAAMRQLFGTRLEDSLESIIEIPPFIGETRYKCRLTWSPAEGFQYQIEPYLQRKISSLKLIKLDEIDYKYKTDQRQQLDAAFLMREQCDDVMIVKNNCITDTWASNLLFYNGNDWVTPDTPLLRGVQRTYLLESNRIIETRITVEDLHQYQKIKLINALIDFERAPEIPMENLCF